MYRERGERRIGSKSAASLAKGRRGKKRPGLRAYTKKKRRRSKKKKEGESGG